ncbi:MAG: T9SS type A sorting domain-containing protein [bacterium]
MKTHPFVCSLAMAGLLFSVSTARAQPDSLWSRTYGWGIEGESFGTDICNFVEQTSDGGYLMAGITHTFAPYGAGDGDFWLIKTDAAGDSLWSRIYEGAGWDFCHSVDITSDGGYILAGDCWPSGDNSFDFWVVRTDENGTQLWNRTFGGSDGEYCRSVQQTSDVGYFLAGSTGSFGAGGTDFWLVKMGPESPVGPLATPLPNDYTLRQNWPNPFNSSTRISYDLKQAGHVSLKVYDLLGQKVATLADGMLPAGSHTVSWNASDFASGVYLYRLQAGGRMQTKKMVLLK